MTAFPDLKHNDATSAVTLGLLSYITPITPIGIDTFDITKPFGLFHFSKMTFVGSLKLIIFFIELVIAIIFLSFNINLWDKIILKPFFYAFLITFLF